MKWHMLPSARPMQWRLTPFGLGVALLGITAVAQNSVPPHSAIIGVLGWHGSTLSVVELDYPSPGKATWYTFLERTPLPFLKAGQTYRADVLGPSAEYPNQRIINFDYGGAHFGLRGDLGLPAGFISCKSYHAVLWALENGDDDCTAADEAKDPIQWKEADAASSLSPREQFELYANAYTYTWHGESAFDPLDSDYYEGGIEKGAVERLQRRREAFLNKLGQLLPQLTPPPAIPEEARKSFIEGVALLKGAANWNDLFQVKNKFRDAEIKAPWWADAFYNDAQVDRRMNLFDDATEALKEYALLNPSDSASRDTRDLSYTMGAEEQVLHNKQKKYLSAETVKYVSGGAQRVLETDAPQSWSPEGKFGIQDRYAYRKNLADLDHHYQNVFRMPDGRFLAIVLEAVPSPDGSDAGDQILLDDLGVENSDSFVHEFPFGTLDAQFQSKDGSTYKVSISNRQSDGVVSVVNTQSGAGVTMPIADLYSARYINVVGLMHAEYPKLGDRTYAMWVEGGSGVNYALLFSYKLDASHADALSLIPTYVVPLTGHDTAIADTGYFIRYRPNGQWEIAK